MQIEFLIEGTADDPNGNPIPKLKMTGKQHWTEQARRYVRWKEFVTRTFLLHIAENYGRIPDDLKHILNPIKNEKVIELPKGRKAYMEIFITWKDGNHADPENVFGSIADSLFQNDKLLSGSFDFDNSRGKGTVLVRIDIYDPSASRVMPQSKVTLPSH